MYLKNSSTLKDSLVLVTAPIKRFLTSGRQNQLRVLFLPFVDEETSGKDVNEAGSSAGSLVTKQQHKNGANGQRKQGFYLTSKSAGSSKYSGSSPDSSDVLGVRLNLVGSVQGGWFSSEGVSMISILA